jgi:hypothetical protein
MRLLLTLTVLAAMAGTARAHDCSDDLAKAKEAYAKCARTCSQKDARRFAVEFEGLSSCVREFHDYGEANKFLLEIVKQWADDTQPAAPAAGVPDPCKDEFMALLHAFNAVRDCPGSGDCKGDEATVLIASQDKAHACAVRHHEEKSFGAFEEVLASLAHH